MVERDHDPYERTDKRLIELEKRLYTLELKDAVSDEQYKALRLDIAALSERVKVINGWMEKLVWLVVSGIGAFVLKFIIEGGLSHVGS